MRLGAVGWRTWVVLEIRRHLLKRLPLRPKLNHDLGSHDRAASERRDSLSRAQMEARAAAGSSGRLGRVRRSAERRRKREARVGLRRRAPCLDEEGSPGDLLRLLERRHADVPERAVLAAAVGPPPVVSRARRSRRSVLEERFRRRRRTRGGANAENGAGKTGEVELPTAAARSCE